jgi:NAD(P)-dependent dehydrogenase (short-subunit alcohol dehydrogenase family)
MKSFESKVAAITGAGSGMGRSLAIQLAQQRCHIALSDVNEAGLAETVTLASRYGVNVTSKKVDVTDRAAMHAWAHEVAQDHGKVNLIFNNAGVALCATVDGASYEELEWITGINFWGVLHGTKAFLPHLKATGEGHIVNTSSSLGLAGMPSQSAYNATKFAVRGFTESLRQELELARCGVSVTSVHPGSIKTNIVRAARMSSSIREIGMDDGRVTEKLEKMFLTTADSAAHTILKAVRRNKRRVLVGPDAYVIDLMVRLFPSGYQVLTTLFARNSMK